MDYGCEKYLAEPVPSAFPVLEKEHSPGGHSLQGAICGAETVLSRHQPAALGLDFTAYKTERQIELFFFINHPSIGSLLR